MTFLHPEFFYFMLPLLLVLFGLLLTDSDQNERIFAPDALKKLKVESDQLSSRTRNVFYFLMFLLLLIALAEPVVEKGSVDVDNAENSLYLVLEKQADVADVDRLLAVADGYKIGLVLWREGVYLFAPATADITTLRRILTGIRLPSQSAQTQRIVLYEAMTKVMQEHKAKHIIMMGKHAGEHVDKRATAYAEKHQLFVAYFDAVDSERSKASINIEQMSALKPSEPRRAIYWHLFIFPLGLAMVMLVIATSSFYRGEKYYLPSLLFVVFLMPTPELKAGLLSYQDLQKGHEKYEHKDFEESAKIYRDYGLKYERPEAIYNAANAYYKAGKYDKAIALYRSIYFVEAAKNRDLFYNLGNALAQGKTQKMLHDAVDAYQKSLKFQEDRKTRENLQKVRAKIKALRSRTVKIDNKITSVKNISKEEDASLKDKDKSADVLLKNQAIFFYKITP